MFFATVAVGSVFCNGGGCFLRRSWWEGMFFATASHVFCIGRVCFLRRWCFLRRKPMFFATVGAVPLPVLFSVGNPCFLRRPEEVMFFATVPGSVW